VQKHPDDSLEDCWHHKRVKPQCGSDTWQKHYSNDQKYLMRCQAHARLWPCGARLHVLAAQLPCSCCLDEAVLGVCDGTHKPGDTSWP
jgi:hypothetical protein